MDPVGDLLVLAPDTPQVGLVVEVKATVRDRAPTEAQLKRYMRRSGCPVALLVTSEMTWMYRDTYADDVDDAIETVGEFNTTSLLDLKVAPSSSRNLERAVFDWLERLSASWASALPNSNKARAAVVEHMVPVVAEGRVVYGHAA